MTNLIFDLNNILHRSLFIVSGYSNPYTFESQSELDQLMRKISTDVAFIIRLINPSRVIFCVDDTSWRKNISIDENDGYKANRTKSTFINWDNVYNVADEFTEIMESKGMIISKIPSAEADDVISMYAKELQIIHNQHVIIVSGDEDLRQLVSFYPYDAKNKKFSFITVFNPFMQGKNASKKLYVPKYFEQWINETEAVDIFNLKGSINVDKEDFKKIITSEKTKIEVVDGRMIFLKKLFCGDDGDNVPSIYSWINDKGVENRITNSKFEKIYEMLQIEPNELIDHYDLIERSDKVMQAIKKISKQNPTFDIKKRIERQIKLVVLDSQFFPSDIKEAFEQEKVQNLSKPKTNFSTLNMYTMLEGTHYVRDRKTDSEAAIFKQIDRIQSNKLF